jgi:hypothetical protein
MFSRGVLAAVRALPSSQPQLILDFDATASTEGHSALAIGVRGLGSTRLETVEAGSFGVSDRTFAALPWSVVTPTSQRYGETEGAGTQDLRHLLNLRLAASDHVTIVDLK